MGGNTFDNTKRLSQEEFDNMSNFIENSELKKDDDYLFPLRLQNKRSHGDFDIIVSDTKQFVKLFEDTGTIKETKIIKLFEERFNLYSEHILTNELYQIDLLKSWSDFDETQLLSASISDAIKITRAYFSYSFANIFFKRLMTIVDRNLKFSYLGVMCSSNKHKIPEGTKYIRIDEKTRLIFDCEYVFNLLDLDYSMYKEGFKNEIKLLEYFEKSKYFNQIKFKNNSKFKHDYSRLKPYRNLVDLGLIKVENFVSVIQ